MKVDITNLAKFAWRHKIALTAVTIIAMMNHENAKESQSKGAFIAAKGMSQEYYCFKESQ